MIASWHIQNREHRDRPTRGDDFSRFLDHLKNEFVKQVKEAVERDGGRPVPEESRNVGNAP